MQVAENSVTRDFLHERREAAARDGMLGQKLAMASFVFYLVASTAAYRGALWEIIPGLITNSVPFYLLESASLAAGVLSLLLRKGRSTWASIGVIVALFSVLGISYTNTESTYLLFSIFLIIVLEGIDLKRAFRTYYVVQLFLVALTMILSAFSVISNSSMMHHNAVVFFYGFTHKNAIAGLIAGAICAMAYVHWDDNRRWWIPFLVASAATVFCHVCEGSRTGAALCACLALVILLKHVPIVSRLSSALAKNLLKPCVVRTFFIVLPAVLLAVLSYCMVCYENSGVFQLLDRLLSGRLSYAHSYYMDFGGITWLGRPFTSTVATNQGVVEYIIDCGYHVLLLMQGVATLVALAVLYVRSICALAQTRQAAIVWILIVLSLVTLVSELSQFMLYYNPVLLFMTAAFAKDTYAEKGKLVAS